MAKRSYVAGLLQGKCPRCREGNIFTYPISRITKFNTMNMACPMCEVRLEPEPGFYQGAMYVGYGITIVCMLAISLILYYLFNPPDWVYMVSVIGFMLLIAPLNYRYSRIVYLYFFGGIGYDPEALRLRP